MRTHCTKLITASARWPARKLPANSQLLCQWQSAGSCFRSRCCPRAITLHQRGESAQTSALAVAELSGSFCRYSAIHSCSASSTGLVCCWRMPLSEFGVERLAVAQLGEQARGHLAQLLGAQMIQGLRLHQHGRQCAQDGTALSCADPRIARRLQTTVMMPALPMRCQGRPRTRAWS